MTETLSLTEMQNLVDQLKVGSAILYGITQRIYELHDIDENENCAECKVSYPCNTTQLLLEDLVVSQPAQSSADQSEPDEPSDLHQ